MNNLTKNDLVDQLHLAMRLNQVDLALERINQAQKELLTHSCIFRAFSVHFSCICQSTWKNIATNDAHELMTEALLQDRVEFVKLLLDHSYVNLARYMSPKVLRFVHWIDIIYYYVKYIYYDILIYLERCIIEVSSRKFNNLVIIHFSNNWCKINWSSIKIYSLLFKKRWFIHFRFYFRFHFR